MTDPSNVTIQVSKPWPGAGNDWPDTSEPPSGSSVTEGCWLLGLPSAKLTLDRAVVREGPIAVQTAEEARGQPLLEAILAVEHVDSVLADGSEIIISSKSANGHWNAILDQVRSAIQKYCAVNEGEIRRKVEEILDQEINPGVAAHGGVISLLDVRGTTVFIKMGGGCQGCGMASVTLKQGVEKAIAAKVPEVTQILDTTDHASGNNPFYAPTQK